MEECASCCCCVIIIVVVVFCGVGIHSLITGDDQEGDERKCVSYWSRWSDCSRECGAYGTQIRLRTRGPGEPTTDEQPCNRVCYNGGELTKQGCDCQKTKYSGSCCDCKNIDCELSTWTEWSSCENATTRVRSRDEVRKAECAGARCEGPYMEEQDCDIALILKEKVLVPKAVFIILCIIAGLFALGLSIVIFLSCRACKKKKKAYERAANDDNGDQESFVMG